ncbi:MAG: hypothetical protein IJR29_00855 [Butyrivibrio sp.]|nr:hypothetical protein [Butyrivibrio sp.]
MAFPCLTVPDYFYSQNLQQYTPKIVYIPISKNCEFTESDRNDLNDLDEIAMSFDAYYGSASPLVPVFAEHKKPVMISNYEM